MKIFTVDSLPGLTVTYLNSLFVRVTRGPVENPSVGGAFRLEETSSTFHDNMKAISEYFEKNAPEGNAILGLRLEVRDLEIVAYGTSVLVREWIENPDETRKMDL